MFKLGHHSIEHPTALRFAKEFGEGMSDIKSINGDSVETYLLRALVARYETTRIACADNDEDIADIMSLTLASSLLGLKASDVVLAPNISQVDRRSIKCYNSKLAYIQESFENYLLSELP